VDEERYLLVCMRYIELNPVRAGMVARPMDYVWSSHAHNAGAESLPWLTPAATYRELGRTNLERTDHYRALFDAPIAARDLNFIRESLQACRGLGGEAFLRRVEERTGLPAAVAPRGRPRRQFPENWI